MMKSLIILVFILMSHGLYAQVTYTICGTAADEKGIKLPGATVFIADSKKVASTNSEGKFMFDGLLPGSYTLVVQMMGFTTYHQSVIIQNESVILPVKLQAGSVVLNTVNISGMSASTRKFYMNIFIHNIIGNSDNAGKCKLLNPDAVHFSFNKKERMLSASSDDFLLIENKALGYKVHYLLSDFKWATGVAQGQGDVVSFDGSLYFEELKGSGTQQKKWAGNRRRTYEGSITHFFRSAFNHTLAGEGFLVYRYPNNEAVQRYIKQQNRGNKEYYLPASYFRPINNTYQFFTVVDENFKLFDLAQLKKDSTELYIIYGKKNEPEAYLNAKRRIRPPFQKQILNDEGQISIIQPILDSMVVEKSGNINPSYGIFRLGYWTWGRIADFLPSDYTPSYGTAVISKK